MAREADQDIVPTPNPRSGSAGRDRSQPALNGILPSRDSVFVHAFFHEFPATTHPRARDGQPRREALLPRHG